MKPAPDDPLSRAFLAELKGEFPGFRVVYKAQSRLSAAIAWVLRLLTAGRQNTYMSVYYTVIGDVLYVPPGWDSLDDADRVILLRHERVHLRQRRRLSFPLMAFVYLVPFFPLGLAYGRARLEWEAYAETLRATAELKGLAAAQDQRLKEHIIRRFTGPDYGWMWPFRRQVTRWYESQLARLAQDLRSSANR